MAKFKFAEWLISWLRETSRFEFDWDEGNREKNAAKHGVTAAEAEEVFRSGRAAALGVQVSPPVPEERLGIVGMTDAGRVLQIVFTLRAGRIRPISARPAKRRERTYHEKYLREIPS